MVIKYIKHQLLTIILLFSIVVCASSNDTITPKKFDLGLGFRKDLYQGSNFINKSLSSNITIEMDANYKFFDRYWMGIYYFKNTNDVKSTEFIGNIHSSSLHGFGIKSKREFNILPKLQIAPNINLGFADFSHFIYNTENKIKKFTTNGTSIGLGTEIMFKLHNNLYLSATGDYKHIFFHSMDASNIAGTNYNSTEILSFGTRISVGF